jgi:hypothetical protein
MDIADEIRRIEADINALELSYANGLISVGEFGMRMSELQAILELAERRLRPGGRIQRLRGIMSSQWVRKYPPLMIIVILSIIVRVPRVPHIQGYDGYVLAIESYSLLGGYAQTWLIHPLSYLGIFSFSGYPIGAIATFSLCIIIGGSLEAATLIYIAFFTLIGTLSSYLLSSHLFEDLRYRFIGTVFYVLLPTVYEFSYNSPTARVGFIALLPLFILFLLKWIRNGKPKHLLAACITLTIQLLYHRTALVLAMFIVIAGVYRLLKRSLTRSWTEGEARLLNRFMVLVFMVVATGLFSLSMVISDIIPKHLLPAELYPDWSLPFLRDFMGLSLDYFLFYAIGLFLAIYSFYHILRSTWSSTTLLFEEYGDWALLLLFGTPLLWFIPNPAYTRHLIAPMVACFATYGAKLLIEKRGKMLYILSILMTAPFIVFFQLYNALWRNIEPYAFISSTLFFLLFFGFLFAESLVKLYKTRTKQDRFGLSRISANIRTVIIVSFLLVFTLTNSDMKFVTDMDGRSIPTYVTDEEIAIAEYIQSQHSMYSDRSILLCSHELIEHRISAYAQTNCLSEGLGTALMETGYVTREDALENSTFQLLGNLMEAHWFEHIDPDRTLPQRPWFAIMNGNYSSARVQELLNELHIRFFVGVRGTNESLYKWGEPFESLFRITLTAPIVFETSSYIVYKLD